jgi:tetratricopeptide (TPR) repeat protein
MNLMHNLLARVPVAITAVLTACAAANPGGGAAAAYGPFLAARYADARQDPAAASHFYGLARQADPGNQSLIDESFIAAILAGDSAAPGLARRVGANALAAMLLGNQAALQGDYAAAGQEFSQLPPDNLSGLLSPLLLAWAKAGAGDPAGAIGLLAPHAGSTPFGPIYVLNAALIADQAGDMKTAAAYYASADTGDQSPNLRLAQILASWAARQGNAAAARAELARMAATHPSLALALPVLQTNAAQPVITSPTDGMAEAYLTLAGSLAQPSQALLRETFLRFALALRPDLAAARLLLANLQAGGDRPANAATPDSGLANAMVAKALATLRPIPVNDPLYAPAALQQANLLAALGQTAAAVALLNQLAAASPGSIDPLQEAGDILRDNGQFTDAIAYYSRAIAALPSPTPAAAWPLYYDRGIAEDQTGNWSAAEPDMQTALSLAPNQPYVLNYLGYSWALRGENLPQARAMLQQAAGLAPNEGAIIDSLGFVNLRQGDTADALKLLTRAVEMAPDDAEVNAHLGDAFYAAGQTLQADYQWHRALALKPDPKLQAQIADKLKQFAPPG